jgi:ABC-2 type transport system ATP-binding protein
VSQSDAIRNESGALLEYTGLYERLSAEDNLEFYARVFRLSGDDRKKRIRELLTSIDLWERRRETVNEWSRGMRQKLAVARTLLHRPKLVFLDEPTAGLDPVAAAAFRQDLERLVRQDGLTVFLTTHNLAEAEKLCDQVAVIRKGKLLAVGAPEELKNRRQHNRLIIDGTGITARVLDRVAAHPQVSTAKQEGGRLLVDLKEDVNSASIVQLLVGEGVGINEVTREKASLEDVFLTLVEEEND